MSVPVSVQLVISETKDVKVKIRLICLVFSISFLLLLCQDIL